MKGYCITFRSITYAQNGQRILQRAGIGAQLSRTPRWMEEKGCGYCLQVQERQGMAAADALRAGGAQFRRIYAMHGDGISTEVAL